MLQPHEHKGGGTTFGPSSHGPGKLHLERSHKGSITQQHAFLVGSPSSSGGSSVWVSITVLSMPYCDFSEEFSANIQSEPLLVQLGAHLTSQLLKPSLSSKGVTKLSIYRRTSQSIEGLLNAASLVAFLGFVQLSAPSWFCKGMAMNPGNS